jgi:putative acetyltransferase
LLRRRWMSITIRPAAPNDVEALSRLYAESVRGLAAGWYTTEQIEGWASSLTPERVLHALTADRMWAAEASGELAGMVILAVAEAELGALYVSSKHARKGVGTALMQHAEGAAVEAGLRRLTLRSSLNAHAFYLRSGWEDIERINYRTQAGTEFECVLMRKELGGPDTNLGQHG